MKNVQKLKSIVCLLIFILLTFGSCGIKSDLIGTYESTFGTVLKIKEDGTLEYDSPYKNHVKKGEWKIKDDKIILSGCESYDLYASIDEFDGELYIEAKKSTWMPETFKKED